MTKKTKDGNLTSNTTLDTTQQPTTTETNNKIEEITIDSMVSTAPSDVTIHKLYSNKH